MRRLTHPGDRLIAISAIAELYRRNDHDVYLAGLWSYDLLSQLCWKVPYQAETHRPLEYRAPSWSWAAIDLNIRMFPGQTEGGTYRDKPRIYPDFSLGVEWVECGTQILDTTVTQDVSNTTSSPVRGGHITVKGKTQACSWQYKSYGIHLDGMCDLDVKADAIEQGWDVDFDATAEVLLLMVTFVRESALRDLTTGRGLILVTRSDDSYRRVGTFETRNVCNSSLQYLFDSFVTKTVTIV
jgi:hypothetical protein